MTYDRFDQYGVAFEVTCRVMTAVRWWLLGYRIGARIARRRHG